MAMGFLRKGLTVAIGAVLAASALGQSVTPVRSTAASLVGGERRHLFGGQYEGDALPAAVNPEWTGLIGEYGWELSHFYVLEDGGELKILSGWFDLEVLHPKSADVFELAASGPHGEQTLRFARDAAREATGVEMDGVVYKRRPFDGPNDYYHITPVKPVEVLRKEALADRKPEESGVFRKPDLVQLNVLDPTIKLDIRYATSRNFLGSPLYLEARAYMQRPAAEAVVRASQKLSQMGYGLIIHDSYRPWYVTKMFWDGTPVDKHGFVANPAKGSKHNRGCAVDLSLYSLRTGEEIRMTGGYDEMSDRSHPFYPGGTSRERWHRDLLRSVMEAEGFTVDGGEWWHFDYKDWRLYPILNATFEELEKAGPKGPGR